MTWFAIGTVIVTAIGEAVSLDQQRHAANVQQDNINHQREADENALVRQRDQQRSASAAAMNDENRRALHDTALFDAVAGEYGGGNSVDRGRAVATIGSSERLATLGRNDAIAGSEIGFSSLRIGDMANERLATIQQPNYAASALRIGGAGVSAYGSYTAGQNAKFPVGRDRALFDENGRALTQSQVDSRDSASLYWSPAAVARRAR